MTDLGKWLFDELDTYNRLFMAGYDAARGVPHEESLEGTTKCIHCGQDVNACHHAQVPEDDPNEHKTYSYE